MPVGLIQVRKWKASRHGQDQFRGGSVWAEGRKPKALLTEVRSGFIEQKRELQEAVREQPKPLAYDTPADVVRNVLARLNEPYSAGFEPTDADARAALGLKLTRWTMLEEEICGDFEEQSPYGIGWWAPEPGTSRRILVSDQLYCWLTGVVSNMIEAGLHWLEYLNIAS